MQGLASIVGQDRAVGRLRAALRSGKTHHAYLFEGPEGVGKRTAALALAQAWNCEAAPGEGCGRCGPCLKITDGAHPDVVAFRVFNEEGKVKEQTERVRELIATLAFPPHEGRARLVLVDPAHELNFTASNVLLKTLEEPPSGTHFVLVTAAASRLLTTVRSRCQRVPFLPLADEVVAAELVARHGYERQAASAAAALAGGSLARALELAQSDDLPRRRECVTRWIATARGGKATEMLAEASEAAGDREGALAALELLWVTYHDALLMAEGRSGRGEHAEAERLAARVPTTALLRGVRAVSEASEAVRGFVSPQLVLERLLLRLSHGGAV